MRKENLSSLESPTKIATGLRSNTVDVIFFSGF